MAIDIEAIKNKIKEQMQQEDELFEELEQLTDKGFIEVAKEELWHIKHYSGMEFYIQTLDNLIDIIKGTAIEPKRAISFAERGYNAERCIESGIVAAET